MGRSGRSSAKRIIFASASSLVSYEPGIGIPCFSNPNVLFRGMPTGVLAGQPNVADNARTINTYAPTVANRMRATNHFEFASVNGLLRTHLTRLAEDGSPDASFTLSPGLNAAAANGTGGEAHDLAVQPDGKILIAGAFTAVNGVPRRLIARLNVDGTVDSTFVAQPNSDCNNLSAVDLQADGTLHRSFSPALALGGEVWDFAALPDGRIVIVGSFCFTGGTNRNAAARLNPDGTLDPIFNAGLGPNDIVRALAIQPNGWVVIGGHFTSVNGQPCKYLARLRSDPRSPRQLCSRLATWV